jgi:hypothetical protein
MARRRLSLPAALLLCPLALGVSLAQAKPAKRTHLGGKVTSMITLSASVDAQTESTFFEIGADGTVSPFSLPADTALVITDVQCGTSLGNVGILLLAIEAAGITKYLCRYDTGMFGIQRETTLTSGVVFSVEPSIYNNSGNGLNGLLTVHGYLVRNK